MLAGTILDPLLLNSDMMRKPTVNMKLRLFCLILLAVSAYGVIDVLPKGQLPASPWGKKPTRSGLIHIAKPMVARVRTPYTGPDLLWVR